MPDGSFQAGKVRHQPPHPDALWRDYHECVERILRLYKDNLHGYQAIAKLNPERAVFDSELLAQVARSRQKRMLRTL